MNKRKALRLVIGFLCCLFLGGMALAISSDNYRIDWDVIAGGGGEASSASHTMRSTIGQAAIGPSSSANFQLGAGYWYGVAAPLPPGFAFIKMWFMTPEGEPYPFDVIISDGTWRKEWKNVTCVETEVPTEFTFAAVYTFDTHHELYEFSFSLSPGEIKEFEFYAINPYTVLGRIRPYLIGKEVGITVNLTWQYFDNTLTYTVQTEPSGKYVFVDTWIQTVTDGRSGLRYVSSWAKRNGQSVSCSLCPNGEDYEPDEEIPHTFVLPDIVVTGSEVTISYGFSLISENRTPVGIRKPLYNQARIDKYKLKLHTLDGLSYDPQYFYLQWAVLPGGYILELYDVPEDYAALNYPLFVSDNVDAIVFDPYPPKIVDLEPYVFSIAGEDFFAHSSYSNLIHGEENKKVTVDVSTEIPYDWWGYFVLPDSHLVKSILACAEGACEELSELTDYTVNRVEGYNIVVVRIEPAIRHISLTYEYRIYLPLIMKNYPILTLLKP